MKYLITVKEINEQIQDPDYKVTVYEQTIDTTYKDLVRDIIKAANEITID